MAKVLFVITLTALSGILAEPPVDRQYLPPGQAGYSGALSGAPAPSANFAAAPSSQYGAPSNGFSRLSSSTPSSRYGAPGVSRAGNRYSSAPSSRYGAPSSRLSSSNGLSNRYAAPGGASRFGAPSQFRSSGSSSRYSAAPSSRYGAPSALSAPSALYGAPSALSAPAAQYGAPPEDYMNSRISGQNNVPSGQYGAPSNFASAPSSQYGAPAEDYMNSRRSGENNVPSAQYGAPSNFPAAPSNQYGAPAEDYMNSRRYGQNNVPSAQYGAPTNFAAASSSQYRVPAAAGTARFTGSSDRFGSALSSRNGAPAIGGSSRFASGPASSYGAAGASRRQGGAPAPVYGPPVSAYSGSTEDPLAEPANYDFSYGVQDAESGSDFGHTESRQDDAAQGEYRVVLPDGRTQIVEYEANDDGYNPVIRYEEEGNEGYADSQRSQGGPY